MKECKRKVKQFLLEEIELRQDLTDNDIKRLITTKIIELSQEYHLSYPLKEKIATELFQEIRQLDVIEELIQDSTISEIMINGFQEIYYEKYGQIKRYSKEFESINNLENLVQQIVAKCNRMVNESSPIVDARLQDGSRVNIVLPPVAVNGPIVTIRKFPQSQITVNKLIECGTVTNEAMLYLERLVISGYNIIISGGTGSGKTTFLNALSCYISADERVITIEDNLELKIQGVKNLVQLETRNANVEGCNPITIRDLIKTSLRMRPNRIIVGEVRGGEAIDMLQAFSTGHDGSLSTIHANSAQDAAYRLETMVLMGIELPISAIKRQISSSVDIIIQLGRQRDGSRKLEEIVEVLEVEEGEMQFNTLFILQDNKLSCLHKIINDTKLRKAGLL